jgi:hypothetical protein
LYYAALGDLGLLRAALEHYRLPYSERFGVRAIFTTLFCLTLLGKTTVESAKHLTRRSFGAVIGTERAPCVKTIRRKLKMLVRTRAAAGLGATLAGKWIETAHVGRSRLYVDGHMTTYSGKRKIREFWNAQRRMPLPGIMSYFVSDEQGRPLLLVSGDVGGSLAKEMRGIVQRVQDVMGQDKFTVIFDRGGYDGELFGWMVAEGIDFITYQKGSPNLPQERFALREARVDGERHRLWISEDEARVGNSGPWRRVTVRTPDGGHQTPILTSLPQGELSALRVASLIFKRWRQENFFKYMKEHHGLDELHGQDWEPRPGEPVPNPERERLRAKVRDMRRHASTLEARLAEGALFKPLPSSKEALETADAETLDELRSVRHEAHKLEEQLAACPEHVPAAQAGRDLAAMKLEAKWLIDRVKMTAYNAEESLLELMRRHYHNPLDCRDLLRAFTRLSGEIRTEDARVIVTLDPPDTPLHCRVLRGMCTDLTKLGATFPGTDIPVEYRVAMHYSKL